MRWTASALLGTYAALALLTADCLLRPARADDADPAQKFRQADRDGSGALEPGEVPHIPPEAFARADRDGSGGLSLVEVIRWRALSDARTKPGKRDEWRRKFREADKDGDGAVTKAEFPAPEMLFERFDRDGDGKVTWAEARAFGIEEEVAKLFEKHDADLSGTLSRDELPTGDAQALFLVADQDGDGQVTGEEVCRFMVELTDEAERGESPGAAMGAPAAPAPTAAPAPPGGVLQLVLAGFAQLDRDHDGALGRDEFPGSRELLVRIDLDRDGKVGRPELELRLRQASQLSQRGERLRQRAKELGVEPALGAIGAEAIGLFAAGRLEEVARLLDEVELWLEQQARR